MQISLLPSFGKVKTQAFNDTFFIVIPCFTYGVKCGDTSKKKINILINKHRQLPNHLGFFASEEYFQQGWACTMPEL